MRIELTERADDGTIDDSDNPAKLLLPHNPARSAQHIGEEVVELRPQPQLYVAQLGMARRRDETLVAGYQLFAGNRVVLIGPD